MSKKLPRPTLQRPSTRSISLTKSPVEEDKYKFQSDDEDHQVKPRLIRRSPLTKRPRGRPPKSTTNRSSISTTDSDSEEKKRHIKRSYEKPITRGTTRVSPTADNIRDKIKINSTPPILITPKKRGRKPKMLSNSVDQGQKTESEIPTTETLNKPLDETSPLKEEKDPVFLQPSEADEFSDDSVEMIWKGSSKMSIEILKRRFPKDESHSMNTTLPIHSDPTAQRKRAIIPRLTDFDALSGKPISNDERSLKKITTNKVFSNDFDYASSNRTNRLIINNTNEEKTRPRVYAVKSTTLKSRTSPAPFNSDIKRPKWMNDQHGKSDDDGQQGRLSMSTEEAGEYDHNPRGQYSPVRANYRGRPMYPNRRPGSGLRGRPPGSRRNWNNEDDDDDYDQYEDNHGRYGSRKAMPYRSSRSSYDNLNQGDEDYDKSRRMSLTQAYRQPVSNSNVQRRIPMNNGNHSGYKDDNYYATPLARPGNNRVPISAATTTINNNVSMNSGNTFVAKINDAQLNDVANQSQIFFVNVPQQDQKNTQLLSVLASEQQQVLPVAVVQQAKVEAPTTMTNVNAAGQNQTVAFTLKLPVETPKQKKILPKPSGTTGNAAANNGNKPFSWSRPPGRLSSNNDDHSAGKGLHITPINTDLDTMEAAHVLATAADVTMAADARRKAQQHDDEMAMMVDETPSNVANEETVQCEDDGQKVIQTQSLGSITANIIDENGVEHTVILSTEEAQQLLGSQGAIFVDSDGQQLSIQQPQTQTFMSSFALDQAQLQALLVQAGIDPNTPLTIEQIDSSQQQQQQTQVATLCTSPGGTQYTVLTQGPVQQQAQQQFILQTATIHEAPAPVLPQPIAPKEEISSPPKRRAFAVKSTVTASEPFDENNSNERPRRKIFATKSSVTPLD